MLGNVNIEIEKGGSFTDPGSTAFDFEDGDITADIIISGNTVNVDTPGYYSILYDVSDSQGLQADQKERVVYVKDDSGGGGGVFVHYAPTLVISNEMVEHQDNGDFMITWDTNAPATSQVLFGTSSISNLTTTLSRGYNDYTSEDILLSSTHAVLVPGLNSELAYFFRPISDNVPSKEAIGEEISYHATTTPVVPTIIPPLQVCTYLTDFLKMGADNNPTEVEKLQNFLKNYQGYENVVVNGIFDSATYNAVIGFQMDYSYDILTPWGSQEPTGFVYITTRNKINELYCSMEIPLTAIELAEIENYRTLLESLPQGQIPQGQIGMIEPQELLDNLVSGEDEEDELVIDETGFLANINDSNKEGGEVAVAGLAGLVTSEFIYWLALILAVLCLISFLLFFRNKRKKKIIHSVPENIPVR